MFSLTGPRSDEDLAGPLLLALQCHVHQRVRVHDLDVRTGELRGEVTFLKAQLDERGVQLEAQALFEQEYDAQVSKLLAEKDAELARRDAQAGKRRRGELSSGNFLGWRATWSPPPPDRRAPAGGRAVTVTRADGCPPALLAAPLRARTLWRCLPAAPWASL